MTIGLVAAAGELLRDVAALVLPPALEDPPGGAAEVRAEIGRDQQAQLPLERARGHILAGELPQQGLQCPALAAAGWLGIQPECL